MKKARLILILISNIFMLTLANILNFFKCKKLVNIIIKQAKINTNHIENIIGVNENE